MHKFKRSSINLQFELVI